MYSSQDTDSGSNKCGTLPTGCHTSSLTMCE